MKNLFYFECVFDMALKEEAVFKTYYGPIIKEDKHTYIISNKAENSFCFHNAHFGKLALEKKLFESPEDVNYNEKIIPHENSYIDEGGSSIHTYWVAFFFDEVNDLTQRAAEKCKESCMKEYQTQLKLKIDELKSNLNYTKIIAKKEINKFD